MPVRVERVGAAETLALRQRVLRPHETIEQLSLPGDDDPDTGNFVALDGDEVVGTASVRREAPPWAPDLESSWRLRGMATAESRRSQGVGTAVLDAVVEHVHSHGGGHLWCNARTPAVAFYRRSGFLTRGESWDEPMIGPHIAMERAVSTEA
jgi:GNAT superfamily N-acetyltransferase